MANSEITFIDGPGGTLVTAASLNALKNNYFNVKNFGALGDGTTNDYTAINAAITAASGGTLYFPPGTYLVGTRVIIGTTMRVIGNGATIKRAVALDDYALEITADDVVIEDLNVDGNRAAGSTAGWGNVHWYGVRGIMRRCKATNGNGDGIIITHAAGVAELTCYDCEASDIVTAGTGGTQGVGFECGGNATMRLYNCRADWNGEFGVVNNSYSYADGYIDGTFNHNGEAGIYLKNEITPGGTGGRIVVTHNKRAGINLQKASGWSFDYVESNYSGDALNPSGTGDPSGNGVTVGGSSKTFIGEYVCRNSDGYGLAIVRDGAANPSNDCHFGTLYITDCGDPAVIVSGGGVNNTFGSLTVVGGGVAMSFGESAGTGDRTRVDFLHAIRTDTVVITADVGSNNTFGHVIATECQALGIYTSFIQFDSTSATGNVIERFEAHNPTTTPPAYLLKCINGASGNIVRRGMLRTAGTALLSENVAGANTVTLLPRMEASQLVPYSSSMTFDALGGWYKKIAATNTTAFTVNAPFNPLLGQELMIDFFNSSGGTMGTPTLTGFTLTGGAFTKPANTKHRWVRFYYDGTSWIETSRAGADI